MNDFVVRFKLRVPPRTPSTTATIAIVIMLLRFIVSSAFIKFGGPCVFHRLVPDPTAEVAILAFATLHCA